MSDISHLTVKETYSDLQGAMYTPLFREDVTPGDLTPGFSFYLSHPVLQCLSYSKLTCFLFPKCASQGRWSFATMTNQLKISEAHHKNVVSCSLEVYCRFGDSSDSSPLHLVIQMVSFSWPPYLNASHCCRWRNSQKVKHLQLITLAQKWHVIFTHISLVAATYVVIPNFKE